LPQSQAFNAQENLQIPALRSFLVARNTDSYDSAIERTAPYIIGPAAEIRLWHRIRVEVDGLHSRAVCDYTSIRFDKFSSQTEFEALKHKVDGLEIPVILEYEFAGRRRLRPFVGAGMSIWYNRDRVSQGMADWSTPGEPPNLPFLFNPSLGGAPDVVKGGPAFAAGSAASVRRLRISVEIRYTRLAATRSRRRRCTLIRTS
jgi:hypothetical protein